MEAEEYVTCLLYRKERSYLHDLTQLRLGILPIKIESNRFDNIAVEDRLCELCDVRVVKWKIMYGHPNGSEHITLRALRGELLLRTSEGDQVHYLTYTLYVTQIAMVPDTPTGVKQPSITF